VKPRSVVSNAPIPSQSKIFRSGSTQYASRLSNIFASKIYFRSVAKSVIHPAPSHRTQIVRTSLTWRSVLTSALQAHSGLTEGIAPCPKNAKTESGTWCRMNVRKTWPRAVQHCNRRLDYSSTKHSRVERQKARSSERSIPGIDLRTEISMPRPLSSGRFCFEAPAAHAVMN
jgi:hypothetical protein